jgi:hypothetical protein
MNSVNKHLFKCQVFSTSCVASDSSLLVSHQDWYMTGNTMKWSYLVSAVQFSVIIEMAGLPSLLTSMSPVEWKVKPSLLTSWSNGPTEITTSYYNWHLVPREMMSFVNSRLEALYNWIILFSRIIHWILVSTSETCALTSKFLPVK